MKYVMYRDNQNLWRWTFYASNGKIIAVSSESYYNESDCLHSIQLVKGSRDAPVYKR